jgi:uncharacterized RDD family membrane protein YckC
VKRINEAKCAQCGTPAALGAKFCESCGAPLPFPSRATQGVPSAEPIQPYAAVGVPVQYQGVAIRFVAQLVDVTILGAVFWMLGFTGAGEVTIDAATQQVSISPFLGLLILIDVIIAFLYFTILEGTNGKTVGKMILNIKVVKQADYSSISYIEAAVRTIMRVVDLIPFFVPYLLAAVCMWSSESKQRLGDRVARTLVVRS